MSTAEWLARDAASVWHPFTQHSVWLSDEPTVVERAEGAWLYDTDGRRYLDGVSSLWVTTFGHGEPAINDAIREQLGRLDHATFLGSTHPVAIELAEELLSVAPRGDRRLSKVFYAGDGSSAVEAAIKMAYQHSVQSGRARPLFVRLTEAYHGDTLGAVSVGGIDLFHATYKPLLLKTLAAPSPAVYDRASVSAADAAAEAIRALDAIMAEHGDDVSAIIVEPMVQAAAGILTYDASYLKAARELADRHGALLICDEVATGVGRTGRMWASEHAGIVPDLLITAKGLTGGYLPLSAVLATDDVYASFLGAPAEARTFFHGHTYTANPLCAAAALANLRLMRERDLLGHVSALGERFGELLAPLAARPGVTNVRRLGVMAAVEVAALGERTGFRVCQAAKKRGVWLRPLGDAIVIMPPLALSMDEAEILVGALDEALSEVIG
ncbi:adenosylmethionine-8-amino-7-oxononanoate aminotransferase [Actinorhabdospora filicis]|uniref:Adenosylmethionine-8-amino-7-oxononanoate aminotransferase n=1 Tax=Actinorhabdospora filicis TaxID=1785913 RepID=A0A9W6SPU0_9ACTN|nr:adenosylmethionine--8-amino-7-oxononanoate transaminase [Actinorhabdospora filicis]GLZ80148.1 adenosylmethionine-8-amino-7-oxononanoate aminotransferase [Actinorhabdospora filicis]